MRKIKEKLTFCKNEIKKYQEKEKEINMTLKELEKKYLELQKRFIPINIKKKIFFCLFFWLKFEFKRL